MTALYDVDFFLWSQTQANLLREGKMDNLDYENLIEEIESLGRSEKRTLRSYLEKLMMHLLKTQFQPERNGRSWQLSIKNARRDFLDTLSENPSLKHKLSDIVLKAYESARNRAAIETGLDDSIFPEVCPWSIEELCQESQ